MRQGSVRILLWLLLILALAGHADALEQVAVNNVDKSNSLAARLQIEKYDAEFKAAAQALNATMDIFASCGQQAKFANFSNPSNPNCL
jgi:hypothetical protein